MKLVHEVQQPVVSECKSMESIEKASDKSEQKRMISTWWTRTSRSVLRQSCCERLQKIPIKVCFLFYFYNIFKNRSLKKCPKSKKSPTNELSNIKKSVWHDYDQVLTMADTSPYNHQSLRRKTRSASICAPGSQSMEQMLSGMPPLAATAKDRERLKKDSGSATPDSSSTPTRKRRPATRSQSARVSGANKSIRRKRAEQGRPEHIEQILFYIRPENWIDEFFSKISNCPKDFIILWCVKESPFVLCEYFSWTTESDILTWKSRVIRRKS